MAGGPYFGRIGNAVLGIDSELSLIGPIVAGLYADRFTPDILTRNANHASTDTSSSSHPECRFA
jgi:hypothetical protein